MWPYCLLFVHLGHYACIQMSCLLVEGRRGARLGIFQVTLSSQLLLLCLAWEGSKSSSTPFVYPPYFCLRCREASLTPPLTYNAACPADSTDTQRGWGSLPGLTGCHASLQPRTKRLLETGCIRLRNKASVKLRYRIKEELCDSSRRINSVETIDRSS